MSEKQHDLMIRGAIERSTVEPDYEYSLVIQVGGFKVKALSVVSITFRQDYVNDLFSDNAVTVAVTPAIYNDVLVRGGDRIEVTLTKKPYLGTVTTSKKYVAIIVDKRDVRMEGNADEAMSAKAGNNDLRLVTLQLFDKPAFDMRLRSFGGIFVNMNGHGLLKFILGSMDLTGSYSSDDTVGAINVTGTPFDRQYKRISIPEGTSLMAVPDYIQDTYGVYSSGLGVFFKDRNWYMFPPWAVSRQSSGVKSLTVINAPANRYSGLDRNHFERGNTLTVVATGETAVTSETDNNNLNLGTAVRFADAEKLMSSVTTEDPTADPKVNSNEYITEYGHGDYKGKLNNVVTAKERFISNPAVPASELARRGGDVVTVTWHKGLIEKVYPGMPVLYFYRTTNKVIELKGTLIGATEHSTLEGGTLATTKHVGYVTLRLFLKRGE